MKRIRLLLFTCLLVTLVACSSQREEPDVVAFNGSYEYFQTIDDLFKEATDVLEITVLKETRAFEIFEFPSRSFEVEVKDVYKGNLVKGDYITVNEMGGIYYPHLFGDPEQPRQKKPIEMRIEGAEMMKAGDHLVIFTKLDDELNDGSYTQFGLWQSKFIIKGGSINRGVDKELYPDNIFNSAAEFKEKLNVVRERNEKNLR